MAAQVPTTLDPIHPSAAIRIAYDIALNRAVDQMAQDVSARVTYAYQHNEPEPLMLYGADASPARILADVMARMGRKWGKRFDKLSTQMAEHFARDVTERCDRTLQSQLRAAGFTVRFKMTAAMNEAFQAVKAENVSLIRSIPDQHIARIEGLVQRSVAMGRDLASLAQGLQRDVGITKRRASLIALDQNNKATAAMNRARRLQLGIRKAKWLHSAGGKEPRPSHVAFSGQEYDIEKGVVLDEKDGVVWPGTAIRCRCVDAPVIEGFI